MPLAPGFLRLTGPLLALALAVAAPLPASAQQEPEFFETPFAPGQWNIGRRLDESELRYCIDPRDPSWEVAGDIADAIAGSLLLLPQRYVVESETILEDLTKTYAILLEHCDLYMGFRLIPDAYPAWVTLTRPYYETGYVFVAADPALHALADLAPGRPIAATSGSTAHLRLVSYLWALPAERRWQAWPMGTNERSLDSVLDGTADVALVWAPNLWARQREDPAYADLRVIDPKPLPPTPMGVGALLLSNETFLRTAVDEAIAALTADGTIAGILEEYGFPGTAAP